MKTIHKFQFDMEKNRTQIHGFPMAMHSRILTVQVQHGLVTMWAEVETEAPIVVREFIINGTGQPMHPRCGVYIGSVGLSGYVWHVYESDYADRMRVERAPVAA